MGKERWYYLDLARVLAITLVVIGHYCPETCPEWWRILHNVIYSFHMPLFLFLSGFLYARTGAGNQPYKTMLTKKIKSLLVPYLSTSVLIICIKLLSQSLLFVENPVTVYSFIRILYLPEAGYFLWFLWALWWMFVLVGLFRMPYGKWFFLMISVCLFFLPWKAPEAFCFYQTQRNMIYFALGVFLGDVKSWDSLLEKLSILPLLLWLGFVVISERFSHNDVGIIIYAVLGIFGILSLCKTCEHCLRKTGKLILSVAASVSFTIYLFHTTFMGFAKAIIVKVTPPNSPFIIGASFSILAGILFPIAIHFVMRRWKACRFLFAIR